MEDKDGKQSNADITINGDKLQQEIMLLQLLEKLIDLDSNDSENYMTGEQTSRFKIYYFFNDKNSLYLKFRVSLDVFENNRHTYFEKLDSKF